MMGLRFTKMQGIGNDFVVLDRRNASNPLPTDWIRRLSDRHFGVGCDQVMTIERSDDDRHAFRYGVYNADGSLAGQCGNGVRCVVRWLADRGLVRGSGILLLGPSGTVSADLLDDGRVRVDLGVPAFEAERVPLTGVATCEKYLLRIDDAQFEFGAVSIGNPHVVIQVGDVDSVPVTTIGARISAHPMFPERTNVGFVQVLDRGQIRLRVYERGVGETLGCGSGACAAVAVLRRWQLVDSEVRVQLPGGDLDISWAGGDHPVRMTGSAVTVFEGEWIGG